MNTRGVKSGRLSVRVLATCVLAGVLALGACNRAPKEVQVELASVGEQMAFDKKEITVPAGSKVTITFKNNATSAAMTHNFVLVQGGMVEAVGTAAASVGIDKGYVPSHYAIIAKPGETITFSFVAPPSGSYEFLCTTPGHFAVMRGTFISK
jgi:azurin